MRRTILIGDVHGCLDELRRLVRKCGVDMGDDVVLVGDLIAKGPDSQGVVQYVRESGFSAVLGNHDAHVLRIKAGTLEKPAKPTHQSVADALTDGDWRFLSSLPLYQELEEGLIVVHAGLVPGVPLQEQKREHLLNLRSIDDQGRPSKKVEGVPWGAMWRGPSHVVFGHDAVRGLQQHAHATGLDSGCVYGKALTALIWPERTLVSVPAKKVYADPAA